MYFKGYLFRKSSFVENFEPAKIRDAMFSDGSASCLESNLQKFKRSLVQKIYMRIIYIYGTLYFNFLNR